MAPTTSRKQTHTVCKGGRFVNRPYNQILIFTVGDDVLGIPKKQTIIVCETGGETPPLRGEYYVVVGEAFRLLKNKRVSRTKGGRFVNRPYGEQ